MRAQIAWGLHEGSDSLHEGSDSLHEGSDSLHEGSDSLRLLRMEDVYMHVCSVFIGTRKGIENHILGNNYSDHNNCSWHSLEVLGESH